MILILFVWGVPSKATINVVSPRFKSCHSVFFKLIPAQKGNQSSAKPSCIPIV